MPIKPQLRRSRISAAGRAGAVVVSLIGALTGCAGGAGAVAPPAPSSVSTPPGAASDAATSSQHPATAAPSQHPDAAALVLGSSTSAATKGYGTARPAEIDGGGDSAGIVSDVRWSSWGGAQATGTGTALYAAADQSNAQGRREKATVVAFEPGQCDGRPAYRKLTWFFPQHGEHLDPTAALDICDI